MRLAWGVHAGLVALVAAAAVSLASVAVADSGTVSLRIVKGGFFVGASGGSGTLTFRGKRYALSIGGISGGLVFGAAETRLRGTVSNINRPADVAGVYGAIGAGGAVGRGARVIALRNEKGAELRLQGEQVGLIADIDLSGLAISLR